jgi:hypothetical protein
MAEIRDLPSRAGWPEAGSSSPATVKTTVEQFKLPWGRLVAAYPHKDTPAATVAIYHEMLSGYEQRDILEAVNRLIPRCKYFPTIADIIEQINEGRPTGVWARKLTL